MSSELDKIVQITISKETPTVTRAGFGTFGIISEFSTSKTTVTFDRYRTYADLSEMITDGWTSSDVVYQKAVDLFSQNPKLGTLFVGRKDSGDTDWAAALTAIETASSDWYCFSAEVTQGATVVFDADFVASNAIDFTINGTAVTTVNYTTSQAATMATIKAQIESDITNSTVTIETSDVNTRTLSIDIFGDQVDTVSVAVTGGVSQPTGAVSYVIEDDYKEIAAWVETQKKIFFMSSSSAAIYDAGSTSDIAYFMNSQAYDRTVVIYDPLAQGETGAQYIEDAWPGECLPFDVGEQTWAYKTLSSITSYNLTSAQKTAILAKEANTYTQIAGVSVTQNGTVASGEYIDITRGIDALEAALQEAVFIELTTSRKIPYTDEGITLIQGLITGVLNDFADDDFLIRDTIEVNVPLLSNISSSDRASRILDNITFSAEPQGAIHTVKIAGQIIL